ncbi:MAG: GNAT family N-acetyltransferase [Thiohalocapsa sp.]|nr:GNAT family N-acetyltransferase [Thiohalocapsa sp.]
MASALAAAAAATGQRRLLLLDGGPEWTLQALREALTALNNPDATRQPTWVSARIGDPRLPPHRACELLGGESSLLIYDAHSGLDADGLAAAAGTLRGGGLMILLTPPLATWSSADDPAAERIAVHPYRGADVGSRFIARLARLLRHCGAVGRCSEYPTPPTDATRHAAPAAGPANAPPCGADEAAAATPDQALAVSAVLELAGGRARRALVLTADRGRGKSAALGIAAGQLLAQGVAQILVTAPRREAADAVFRHAGAVAGSRHGLRFIAPDALLAERPPAVLLLVDEAAGIPAPLLERMLTHYGRIAFSTTVHGYEGAGRGFEVRFRGVLDSRAPGWRELQLKTPVRWAPDDPLERLINEALLLDAEPAGDTRAASACASEPEFALLNRDALAGDEPLLRQVFGLLVLGHYQTRPADLRHLLDGPNLSVAVLRAGETVLATALTAREGALEQALLAPIFEGRRRPRGHLLPQTLSAHGGLHEAPALTYARVVRIAVHPAARRRGLGTVLVQSLADAARTQGLDLIGASFGATPPLLRFWRRCGLHAVQLGTHRNAASGAHAAVVLGPLGESGRALCETAGRRLSMQLPVLLTGPLRMLAPEIVAEVLRDMPAPVHAAQETDRRELHAFAAAARTLEAALPALHRFLCSRLGPALAAGALGDGESIVLIVLVLQQHEAAAAAPALGLAGRRAATDALRRAVRRLLDTSS